MDRIIAQLGSLATGIDMMVLLILAIGIGVFILSLGLAAATNRDPEIQKRRIRPTPVGPHDRSIVRASDNDPTGALRLFVPRSGQERSRVSQRLRQAGIHDVQAVRTYFLVRSALSLALPAVFIALAWFWPVLPPTVSALLAPLGRLTTLQVFQVALVMVFLGFYAPAAWLKQKVATRQTEISRGMPGAMDLLQVAVGAGLGFDAAVTRVAHELGRFSPAIAEEFTILQLEIQAGKRREEAFSQLERRTGVAEMAAFSNVVQQSAEFGTPISEALETYATEMRLDRELKAQARANQLPVKMSGVLAGCMMPALLMIILTPVLIRWIENM